MKKKEGRFSRSKILGISLALFFSLGLVFVISFLGGNGRGLWSAKAEGDEGNSLVFTEVSAGETHSCGLADDGNVYCWGYNFYGQLGDGSTTNSSTPVLVSQGARPSGVTFTSITSGSHHTCGLGSDDKGYCWGWNEMGQLGDGGPSNSSTPVLVSQGAIPAGVTFTSITAGAGHTCGLGSDSNAYCWGWNEMGQLGDGSTDEIADTPVLVSQGAIPAGVTFTSISPGVYHTCGLGSDDKGYCWGWNEMGQLGDGSTTNSSTPVLVSQGAIPAGVTLTSITAGAGHTCGLGSDGNVYCWGWNEMGELGDGSGVPNNSTPVLVSQGARPSGVIFTSISAAGDYTCGLGSDGNGYCWGRNQYGRLGNGSTTNSTTPVLVSQGARPSGVTFTSITVGYFHTCGVGSDGIGYCWGWNEMGQLGDGSTINRLIPVAVNYTYPTTLYTNGLTNPTEVTTTAPFFSAIFNNPDSGNTTGVHYQIQVSSEPSFTETMMWDSAKTSMTATASGSRSPNISYEGTALAYDEVTTYYWRIKFWDSNGLESPWSATANFTMSNSRTVSYTRNNTSAGSLSYYSKTVEYGTSSFAPTITTNTGYDFNNFTITSGGCAGEFDSSTGICSDVQEDITIEANWEVSSLPSIPPTELRVVNVASPKPSFGAIFNSPDSDSVGEYYQIQVNTEEDFTGIMMWDSGKTSMLPTEEGSQSPDISYAGIPLAEDGISSYYWKIKFWDNNDVESPWSGVASFVLGVADTNENGTEKEEVKETGTALPKTGASSYITILAALFSTFGLGLVLKKDKKEQEKHTN